MGIHMHCSELRQKRKRHVPAAYRLSQSLVLSGGLAWEVGLHGLDAVLLQINYAFKPLLRLPLCFIIRIGLIVNPQGHFSVKEYRDFSHLGLWKMCLSDIYTTIA